MSAHLTTLVPSAIRPNDYNPNRMSDAEFAELVAEVRHLGRLPKPVVVRPNGDGYVIVDGEHGWRAAQEVRLTEIACEVIQVDDFEAMRQTYKRNQHGQHNPVLQGLMFERMMAESGLSQREFAANIELSEGTVRNSLEYVTALKKLPEWLELAKRHIDRHEFSEEQLRNGYALFSAAGVEMAADDMRNCYAPWITRLSTRQVRLMNRLPPVVAAKWLVSGADIRALVGSIDAERHLAGEDGMVRWYEQVGPLFTVTETEDGWLRSAADFLKLRRRVADRWGEVRAVAPGGLEPEELLPYFKRRWEGDFFVRVDDLMRSALGRVIDQSRYPARLLLTPDEWEAAFKEQRLLGGTPTDLQNRLSRAVAQKMGDEEYEPFNFLDQPTLMAFSIGFNAPEYIRQSKLIPRNVGQAFELWHAEGPEWKKKELAQLERLPSD